VKPKIGVFDFLHIHPPCEWRPINVRREPRVPPGPSECWIPVPSAPPAPPENPFSVRSRRRNFSLFSRVAAAGLLTAGTAVAAAKRALRESGWSGLRPRERTRVLHRWADLIEAEAVTLARLEAVASTRPIGELIDGDIAVTAEQIRFFAEFADKEGGELVPTSDDSLGMILSEPYGVVGAITPWNFPLSMAGWKLGPALAAGNAVVLKPSELTPFSTLYLAELSVRAGLPAGLVNVVLGDGPTTGRAITGHPEVGKISFTGSTGAGAAIMENIAQSGVKPMTPELGGKSPQLVFADADLDLAAGAHRAASSRTPARPASPDRGSLSPKPWRNPWHGRSLRGLHQPAPAPPGLRPHAIHRSSPGASSAGSTASSARRSMPELNAWPGAPGSTARAISTRPPSFPG